MFGFKLSMMRRKGERITGPPAKVSHLIFLSRFSVLNDLYFRR